MLHFTEQIHFNVYAQKILTSQHTKKMHHGGLLSVKVIITGNGICNQSSNRNKAVYIHFALMS